MCDKLFKSILTKVFAGFALLTSCIDPLNVEVNDQANKLVVYAEITTLTAPYRVVISRTTNYDRSNNPREEGATVTVENDLGEVYEFYEDRLGVYESCPTEFVAKVGRTYKLSIITVNDEVYESDFEPILPTGELDSIYYEYDERVANSGNSNTITRGVAIYCNFKDRPERDYLMLDWEGTFKFRASSKDQNNTYCWNTEYPDFEINLFQDNYTNNRLVLGERVTFLEDGLRFTEDYNIQVQLKSLTPEAFEFWQLIQDQYENDGSIFAPTPSPIKSNITCVSDPEKVALGYFFTSAVAAKRMFIPDYVIPGRNEAKLNCVTFSPTDQLPEYCYDCTAFGNSTNLEPEYW